MTTFTENNRFDYPLTPDSWVLDIGAYKGSSAKTLCEKYGCRVVCYEPVKEFFDELSALIAANSYLAHRMVAIPAGVGDHERDETFGVKGELSGIVCMGNQAEVVKIVPIDRVLTLWTEAMGSPPDLLMINAEGMEHEILESLLDNGLESQIRFLQVQPHSVIPRAVERWAAIRNRLLMNFNITSEDVAMDTGWILMERK